MRIEKINGLEIEPRELIEVVATEDNAAFIAKVQEYTRQNALRDKSGESVFAADSLEFILSIIRSKRGEVVMYFDGSNFVGFFELTCPDNPQELEEEYGLSKYLPDADITNMGVAESFVVMPEYRGNHLQAKMFERMEMMASERGITSLIGTVHPENTFSCHNFDVSDYETAAVFEAHGGPRLLKYKEVYKMTKDFDDNKNDGGKTK